MLAEDQQAIDEIRAGNSAAFEELVERYQYRLLGLLTHASGSRDLAEDIAQEAFARAYRKLHLFSGDSQFYTWLARIAMNLLASDRRKKRIENQATREGFDVAMDSVGNDASPDASMQLTETQRFVHQAIAMLDEERRTVLLLRDFDGMDYDGIAESLEIPVGTVRSRLHRARQELKSLLQQNAAELGFS